MVLFTWVVNSSNLLSRPLYRLNDDFVDFSSGLVHFTESSTLWTLLYLVNLSTLWSRPLYGLSSEFVHFVDSERNTLVMLK